MKHILTFYLLAVAVTCYGQKVGPGLHLLKGETYYLESDVTSATIQNVNGRDSKINLTLSVKMAFKVTGVHDTVYVMEACYQSLHLKVRLADTTMDMSSEKNNQLDTPSSIMAKMINKPFTVTLSSAGKIRSVENIGQMIAAAVDSFPEADPAKKEQVKSRFMQSFGENAFKGSLEMGTAIFPQTAVAKNEKWFADTRLTSPGLTDVHTVYHLTGITNDYYQVHGEGTMTSDTVTKQVALNGLPARYQLNGSLLADIKIDKKTGWIRELQVKQLMEGNIAILDNPKAPGGITIPMLFTSEINAAGKQ